jgi:hypothetical protein
MVSTVPTILPASGKVPSRLMEGSLNERPVITAENAGDQSIVRKAICPVSA